MKLPALYIAVRDRDRAEAFYRRFFDAEPSMRNEEFTFFEVGGFQFGLFDPSHSGESVEYGNNCVPNFQVEDLDAEYERAQGLGVDVDPEVKEVRGYRVFQFRDPEDNVIELYEASDSAS